MFGYTDLVIGKRVFCQAGSETDFALFSMPRTVG